MQNWSMYSNSFLGALRQLWARCQGRAETGKPVVSMWWEILCLTGVLADVISVRVGKKDRRVSSGWKDLWGRGR